LLGDSGYALKNILLVPYLHPVSAGEKAYNRAHKNTLVLVEQSFGILKARFLCLSHKLCGPLPFTPERSSKVILACACLHNRARDAKLHDPEPIDEENAIDIENLADITMDLSGQQVRERLVNYYFSS